MKNKERKSTTRNFTKVKLDPNHRRFINDALLMAERQYELDAKELVEHPRVAEKLQRDSDTMKVIREMLYESEYIVVAVKVTQLGLAAVA